MVNLKIFKKKKRNQIEEREREREIIKEKEINERSGNLVNTINCKVVWV